MISIWLVSPISSVSCWHVFVQKHNHMVNIWFKSYDKIKKDSKYKKNNILDAFLDLAVQKKWALRQAVFWHVLHELIVEETCVFFQCFWYAWQSQCLNSKLYQRFVLRFKNLRYCIKLSLPWLLITTINMFHDYFTTWFGGHRTRGWMNHEGGEEQFAHPQREINPLWLIP